MKEKAIQWYKKLGFPKDFDEAFLKILETVEDIELNAENPVKYLTEKGDYGLNLIYFLACCEEMYKTFCNRNIPESVFYACARDLITEANMCREAFGHMGVYEVGWFHSVINLQQVIRIGRLNYGIETAGESCVGGPIQMGDKILLVHIPGGEKLSAEICCQSMRDAECFFTEYYPEHDFKCFVCGSWLLDENMDAFWGEKSNIRSFRELFTLYKVKESDSAIKFVFGRTVTRENISEFVPETGLQAKLQKHITAGGKLHVAYGLRERGL